jgi:hypothetical protein
LGEDGIYDDEQAAKCSPGAGNGFIHKLTANRD